MTSLTYEIYDPTDYTVKESGFSTLEAVQTRVKELKEPYKAAGLYFPWSYRAVYTPIAPKEDGAKSYVEWYKTNKQWASTH